MRVSNFDHAGDRYPKQLDITWEYFAEHLGPHEYRDVGSTPEQHKAAKESCPCFSPASYPEGATRGKRNVELVWMFVLDIDGYPEDKLDPKAKPTGVTRECLEQLVQFLSQQGLTAIVYSTWSHAKAWTEHERCKFRVVIPLDRPVPASSWSAFWYRANSYFGNLCDSACKDASRLYFGPFAPAGTEPLNFYWALPGGALSVEQMMQLPAPEGVDDVPVDDVRERDVEAVSMLVQAWPWQRRHEAHRALAGGLLSSGFSDEHAVDFMCAVARGQDQNNEDREKRQALVEHTRSQLQANEKITGWATLAGLVGYDVAEKVRELVERAPPINEEQLDRYAKQLKRSKLDYKAELGDVLLKVVQKRVFPEPLAMKLAADLGQRFVDYDAKSIALLFEPSLQVMRAEGEDITVQQIEDRIKSKQDEVRQHRREQNRLKQELEQAVEFDKASRIREAFKNGRSHPYTPAELQAWEHQIGTGHRWILQRDRLYYFFFNGSYQGPYSENEAHGAALRELSPAASAGVDIYKVTKQGTDFKSLRQLIAEYGTVAERVVTDLRAQIITYDESERSIIEAPCPLRRLEPVYDEAVDKWMYLMVGPECYDDFKTWCALLPRLDIIRSALALIGEHSVGKSMTGQAGGRFWTTEGPTTLIQAFASFNDAMLRCPLVFADEYLPKDSRGNTPTEQLRAFIQAKERPLNIKHRPTSKLLGVTPLLIAGHDLDILRPTENISNNEVAGSVHRFLIMRVREEAARYLANLQPNTHERGWIDNDIITKHFWWLVYNHPHQKKSRFYFEPSSVEVAMWFATSGGGKASLLRWLVSYLSDRRAFEGDMNTLMLVRVYRGQLLVNIQGPLTFWDKYVGNERCPNAGLMSRLLAEISHPQRIKLPNGKGRMTNYRVVIPDYLYTWAKHTDLMTVEEIDTELARDSVETSVGLVVP